MLLGGDELGRTQQGNNNAYCQDNELSWYDWSLVEPNAALLEFTRGLIQFRKEHPLLRRRRFFEGVFAPGADIKDLTWFKPDGTEFMDAEWNDPEARTIGMRLAGEAIDERGPEGGVIADDTLLVLFNAYHEEVPFILPEAGGDSSVWEVLMDTTRPDPPSAIGAPCEVGDEYLLQGRSVALFRRAPASAAAPEPIARPARRG